MSHEKQPPPPDSAAAPSSAEDAAATELAQHVPTGPAPADAAASAPSAFDAMATESSLGSGAAASAKTELLHDFLAPPQGPGELGRLGPYVVLRVLGSGGMGVVFLAEDPDLRRRIALKVMRSTLVGRPEAAPRFLREARAMAAVQHDHIVPVFAVGQEGAVPYLTMPYLEGESLDMRLTREGRLPAAEVMRLGREVAEGLAAAHARGLIHRDIKPGNIFLEAIPAQSASAGGPALPGGRVKLLDFGLARPCDDDGQSISQSGVIVGTPAYMAPEQARGGDLDARADLFSLGCLLYRMVTGRSAFRGKTTTAVLFALASEHPPEPRALNPQVPPALSALIMRLLAKSREARPASARAVADELARLSATAPIVVPRRRWPIATAVMALLLLLVVSGLLAPRLLQRLRGDKGKMAAKIDDVPNSLTRPFDRLRRADIAAAELNQAGGGDPDKAPPELVAVWRANWDGAPHALLAVSPDEARIAMGPSQRGSVELISLVHGLRQAFQAPRLVHQVIFAGPHRLLLAARKEIALWDAKSGRVLRSLPRNDDEGYNYEPQVQVTPDGKRALFSNARREVVVWDLDAWKEVRHFPTEQAGRFRALALSRDGKRLATSAALKNDQRPVSLYVWEVETGRKLAAVANGRARVGAFSSDGRLLTWVPVSGPPVLKRFDLVKAAELLPLRTDGPIAWLAPHPDGRLVASLTRSGVVEVWDPLSGVRQRTIALPPAADTDDRYDRVVFAPDGRHLLAARLDGTVYVLRLAPAP